MNKTRPILPVSLLVSGRPCLVVGGGNVAARKVGHLLEAEADVMVVSPASCPEIKALAQAGKLQLLERAFEDQDVAGKFLVFAATDQSDVNVRVLDACRKQGVLSSAVDENWTEGNFVTPAICRQKGLVVTVSTGGGSCKRAKMVKDRIAEFLKTLLP